MNANELRVGNIVEIIHIDYGRKINAINVYDLVSIHEESESLSFHPIPLTELWLKRFGFEHSRAGLWGNNYILNGVSIQLVATGVYAFVSYPRCEIKFVHQLQNLYFALTREELTLQDINSENANE